MENESLTEVVTSLNNLKDDTITTWATLLITSMKTLINEIKGFNDLIHKVKNLEDFKAVNEVITTHLQGENTRS